MAAKSSGDVYGKSVEDLQQDIQIKDYKVSGTLKYVENYEKFSGDMSEQNGNYLALQVEVPEGATCTTRIIGGTHNEPVDLTKDKYCVYKIKDAATQQIELKMVQDKYSATKIYDLTGLKLLPKAMG